MSVLVVGISHKTAPVALLERLALDRDAVHKLLADAAGAEHVNEAAVIATCNRLEIYADVDKFHGAVEEVSTLLVRQSDEPLERLLQHLYVHYDESAVSHLFHVVAGLDSMVVGEGQILGQTRTALRVGQEQSTVGTALNSLFQQALRVGKRTHAETDIDHAAPSLVTASLAHAVGTEDLSGRRVVVLGAGAMASLAVSTATRRGGDVVVVNRTRSNADRLAAEYGARAADLPDLAAEIGEADVLVTCAGARGLLVTRRMVAAARGTEPARDLAIIDLALPHDVDPDVEDLPGVTLTGLATLAEQLQAADGAADVADVQRIVAEEIEAFLTARRQASVKPTVVALRSMATDVVEAEMARLDSRLDLAPEAREEVSMTVRRVVDKLLHRPTVRVKELANTGGAVSYAAALAELFALDPDAVQAVTRADVARPAADPTPATREETP